LRYTIAKAFESSFFLIPFPHNGSSCGLTNPDIAPYPHLQQIKQEVIALITAQTEGSVSHRRLKELTKDHPADLTKILHGLVQKSLLLSEGAGQSTFYYLPGEYPIKTELGMKNSANGVSSGANGVSSGANGVSSGANGVSSGANGVGYSVELMHIAKVVAKTQRALKNIVENTIYELCGKQELSAVEIAELLGRKEKNIRGNYLNNMCQEGRLVRKYPNILTHPNQKYKAKAEDSDDE